MRDFQTPLTVERLKSILQYDPRTGSFTWIRANSNRAPAGSVADSVRQNRYIVIRVDGFTYCAHRLAWLYVIGQWPADEIDHKDSDGMNNKWDNLRAATSLQNKHNLSRNSRNRSGFKGVCFDPRKKKFRATIKVDGRQKFLGYFSEPRDAHDAYKAAAVANFGEFARAA